MKESLIKEKKHSMNDCYAAEFLIIFSDDILLSKSEVHLKKIIESNMSFIYTIGKDEDEISFDGCTYIIKIKKNNSDVEKYRSYTIKTRIQRLDVSDSDKTKYAKFNSILLDTIKEIKHSQLNILRDDIASEYCSNGYIMIHELENKMRKLITLFMTTKVGLEWIVASIPPSVIDSIKNDEAKRGLLSFSNFISETDFIQLSSFLFNKYSPLNTNDVHRELQNENIDIDKLKNFVPKSNWERHFSSLIKTKESRILTLWENLYGLRNKIAHNRFITFEEYRRLKSNKERMELIIDEALSKIDSIEVSQSQQETIISEMEASNVVGDAQGDIFKRKYIFEKTNTKNKYQDRVNLIKNVERLIEEVKELLYSDIDSNTKEQLLTYKRVLENGMAKMSSTNSNLKTKIITEQLLEVTAVAAEKYIKNVMS